MAGDARLTLRAAIREWLPEILLLVVTTAAGFWAQGRWLNPVGDPGYWWTVAQRVAHGENCYRDIRMQYGPLSPYLLAAAGRVFGLSAPSFLLLNWVPAVLLGALLLRVARPFFDLAGRLAVLVLLLGIGIFGSTPARLVLPYSPPAVHALCFAVAGFLLLREKPATRSRIVLAGVLTGLALCSKQEIGAAALAGMAVLLWLEDRRLRGWAPLFLLGLAPVVAVAAGFALWMAPFDVLRHENHLWPIGTIPDAWKFLGRLAMGWTPDVFQRVLGAAVGLAYVWLVAGLSSLLITRDPRVRRSLGGLLLGVAVAAGLLGDHILFDRWDPLCLSMLVCFGVALAASRRPETHFIAGFGLFAGLVATRTAFAGQVLWSSYSGIACVATAVTWGLFWLWLAPGWFPGGPAAACARRLLMVAVAVFAGRLAWIGLQDLRAPSQTAVETPHGTVWVQPGLAPFYQLLERELTPGERALVLPEANAVEPLFGLRSASVFPSMLPGMLDRRAEDRILEDARKEPPDAVVLFRRGTVELGVAPLGEGYGIELVRWILRNYRVVAADPNGMLFRRRP